MKGTSINTILKVLVSLGLGIYLTWYLFDIMSEEDITVFKKTILNSNYWLIALSLILALVSYFSRAYRWGYTLWPMGYKSSFKNQYHSIMIGYLVNMTIPRAGEFSRAVMLKRSDNIPIGPGFGTIVTERIIDMIIMFSLAVIAVLISPNETSIVFRRIKESFVGTSSEDSGSGFWMYAFIVFGLILLGLLLIKRIRQRVLEFLNSLKEGLSSIFKVKQYWAYLFHTLIIWISYLVMFALPFYAIEGTSNVPFSGMLLAFSFGALGISFTNGGMGAYPLLIGITTAYYLQKQGVENADAIGNALGMVIWATQTIFLILLGLISFILMPRKYNSKDNE
ncbi:MAG: lysylphosphatidylglycerol synthase transmembrane domain-containing protein [Crocinitomicaceae bacterium]|nr:lysylphosphatidylglycerol synthase transmembrane domain-containing protein [Crocinitomicaceae bacterium]